MAVQLIRKVRDRQPRHTARIDWSNPITRGLRVAYTVPTGNAVLSDTGVKNGSIGIQETSGGIGLSRPSASTDFVQIRSNVLYTDIQYKENTALIMSIGGYSQVIGKVEGSGKLLALPGASVGNYVDSFYMGERRFSSGVMPSGLVRPNTNCLAFISDASVPLMYINGKKNTGFYYIGNYSDWEPTINYITLGKSLDGFASDTNLIAFYLWLRPLSEIELSSVTANPWQIFEPETIPLFFSTVTAQYARPTSDVSTGTWTASSGSDLYAMLDETAASDADYIVTTGASTCEVALSSLNDPAVSTGHVVRYRISSTTGGITVRLRQGTTTIASWTHATAPSSLTTYAQTLTSGEANSITDYTALKLQFEATV